MRYLLKLQLLLLPVLGALLGLACAHLRYSGLLETWQQVGSPGEPVRRILGVREGVKLLVETGTGAVYSLVLAPQAEDPLSAQINWQPETDNTADPVSLINYAGADFITLQPRFEVQQVYTHEFIYKVEGKGELQFALDESGNLWLWSHRTEGLTGLVYYFYPALGFLAGLALAAGMWGVGKIKKSRA